MAAPARRRPDRTDLPSLLTDLAALEDTTGDPSAAFAALAEPTRRRILDLLLQGGEQTVGELVDLLSASQPRVSKHLRTLDHAGLVVGRTEGRRRLYRIRLDGLAEIEAWLDPHRRYWDARLDLLEQHLADHPEVTHPPPLDPARYADRG